MSSEKYFQCIETGKVLNCIHFDGDGYAQAVENDHMYYFSKYRNVLLRWNRYKPPGLKHRSVQRNPQPVIVPQIISIYDHEIDWTFV